MIKINLLPREYQKKKFTLSLDKNAIWVVTGGVLVLFMLAVYTIFFQVLPASSLANKIEADKMTAQNYAKEIKFVNELNAKKDLILTRMNTIEELDNNRDVWVYIISDISSRVTDYLWLTRFGGAAMEKEKPADKADKDKQAPAPSKTAIEGRAFSLNSLATFLVRLKKSPYLQNIDLVSISLEEDKGDDMAESYESYHFVIQCDLVMVGSEAAQTEENVPADKLAAGSEF